jgi:hypothetical protein
MQMGTAGMRSDFLVNKFKKTEGIYAEISSPLIYLDPRRLSDYKLFIQTLTRFLTSVCTRIGKTLEARGDLYASCVNPY